MMIYNNFSQRRMDIENFWNCEAGEDLLSVNKHSQSNKEDIELLPIEGSSLFSALTHESNTQIERIMSFMDKLELPESQTAANQSSEAKGCGKKVTLKKSEC